VSAKGGNLCVLTPIAPGGQAPLEAELGRLQEAPESPFARLERIHFARFQIVPHLKDEAGDQLDATSYLLFASEFDGLVEPHLEALWTEMADEARAVWGRCVGWPEEADLDAFGRYLLEHRIKPGYSVLGYPGATVAKVRADLELQRCLGEFAVAARGLAPEELQTRWRETFG
jgi:hypothetical protein